MLGWVELWLSWCFEKNKLPQNLSNFIFLQPTYIQTYLSLLTLIMHGRGAQWPTANPNDYISGTDYPIDLKPNYIFKFVRCPEVYIQILTLKGPWWVFYLQGSLKISLAGSRSLFIWLSIKVRDIHKVEDLKCQSFWKEEIILSRIHICIYWRLIFLGHFL